MTCQVIRCKLPASVTHYLTKEPLLESRICETHKEQIDDGAAWNWEGDSTAIHMGSDVPPRVVGWSTGGLLPGESDGFSLNLEIDNQKGRGPEQVSLWITPDIAKQLRESLSFRGLL